MNRPKAWQQPSHFPNIVTTRNNCAMQANMTRMDNETSPRSFPRVADDRVSPERKDDEDAGAVRKGIKRQASLIDVSENTYSTNDSAKSAKGMSRSDIQENEDEEEDEYVTNTNMSPTKLASLSRSERKRYRERKRRSDVNKGFEDLMTLLVEIDPEVRLEAEERARRGQWKGVVSSQEENLLSRVDLISRTVIVLRRLHEENEQRKLIIGQLIQESSRNDSLQSGIDEVRSHC
jgi:hypothetical protein